MTGQLRNDRPGSRRSTVAGVGVVAAACAVCCAGPLLAIVGGVSALGAAAAFLLWPAVGVRLAAVAAVVALLVVRRRRRAAGCRPRPDPVPVSLNGRANETTSRDQVGGRW
jgi:membrane protein implicated in regulation of membrane protease activity